MNVKLKEWIRPEHLREVNPGLSFSAEVVNELKQDVLVGHQPVPHDVIQALIMLVQAHRVGITFWCRLCYVDVVDLPATPTTPRTPAYLIGSGTSSSSYTTTGSQYWYSA
jgi:hypothetical protein